MTSGGSRRSRSKGPPGSKRSKANVSVATTHRTARPRSSRLSRKGAIKLCGMGRDGQEASGEATHPSSGGRHLCPYCSFVGLRFYVTQHEPAHRIVLQPGVAWIQNGAFRRVEERHNRHVDFAQDFLRFVVESHTLLLAHLPRRLLEQLIVAAVFPAAVVLRAIGSEQLDKIVRIRIVRPT